MIAGKDQAFDPGLFAVIILLFVFVNEVLNEVENAVTRPDLFPEIGGGKAFEAGRVARAVFVAAVEGNEAGGGAFEFGGEVDEVGIDGEVGETAAEGEERLTRIAVLPVLLDGILHGLTGERIFEFDGEDGDAIEEDGGIEAVFVLLAVFQLANDAEEVALIEFLRFGVERGDGLEEGEFELDAHSFEAVAQDVQRAMISDLICEAVEEVRFGVVGRVLFERFPGFGLGDENEIERIFGKQTKGFVVLLRRAFAIAARCVRTFSNQPFAQCAVGFGVVGTARQQQGFDDGFEVLFRNIHKMPLIFKKLYNFKQFLVF